MEQYESHKGYEHITTVEFDQRFYSLCVSKTHLAESFCNA
jgi:hypothetical protein